MKQKPALSRPHETPLAYRTRRKLLEDRDAQNQELLGQGLRRCALSGETVLRQNLIRFVAAADGVITPDLAERLPGRGVWLTGTRETVAQAVQRGAFARGLKRQVTAPDGLVQLVEDLLRQHVLSALSLANKAGQVLTGFEKCSAALEKQDIIALLHGSEASQDGCRKLDRKFTAIGSPHGAEPWISTDFTIDQLSLAIGRSNVVHAALTTGGAAAKVLILAQRLRRYTGDNAGDSG